MTLGGLLLLIGPSSALASWTAPVSVDPSVRLTSVSCPTSSFCVAADLSGKAMSYTGGSWSTPSTVDSTAGLTAMSCPTTSFCVAVDGRGRALTYNGSSWSSATSIDGSTRLTAVSCAGTSFCAAVDSVGNVITYNGSSWGSPSNIDSSFGLNGVACPSSSFCAAVDAGGRALTYNGSSWSSPSSIDGSSRLTSVSCSSSSFCAAVDGNGNGLTYSGSSWSSAASIDGVNVLNAVACAASFCAAVDSHGNVATYSGGSWAAASDVDGSNHLTGVTCASASFCTAVDNGGNAVTFNGTTWATPVALGGGFGTYDVVSCPAASFCTAVDLNGRALTFDGSSWSTPQSIDASHALNGVSCSDSDFCAAVDNSGNALTYHSGSWGAASDVDGTTGLTSVSCPSSSFCMAVDTAGRATSYNGSGWSSPTTIDGANALSSVSCASSSFCVAVDSRGDAITYQGSWGSPASIDGSNAMSAVSCPSSGFCVAVDAFGNAVTWDGSVWGTPTAIDDRGGPSSVSCTSSSFCAVVDNSGNATTFDGSSWATPSDIDSLTYLASVSCATELFCAAIDTSGSSMLYSADPPSPPVNSGAPAISGSAVEGQILTEVAGTWSNNPTSYSYQWEDCDSLGIICLPIFGATGQTYAVTATDVGFRLEVEEWATNAGGTGGPVSSALTAVVTTPPPPANTSAPSISGTAAQGQTLSELAGGWTNNPTSYSYQWEDCDSAGANCLAIVGATNQTYVVGAGDIGHTIRVEESATNAGGTGGPATSSATTVVLPSPPANLTVPAILGVAVQGQTLTEVGGTWTNSPTSYSYQWEDCDSAGGNCVAIGGATHQTYVVGAGDVGHTIRVQESAMNAGGTGGPASSSATTVVLPLPPVNLTAPGISGSAVQGQTLTELAGTWLNTPTSYSYQWQDCDSSGDNCVAIAGATAQTYVVGAGDVGHTIRVQESATNAGGTAGPVNSAATAVVLAAPPANLTPPSVSGAAVQGQTLTEVPGTWSNSPTSYSHQWEDCDSAGANCVPIGGATHETYVVGAADVGHAIRVQESATNDGGTGGPASSSPTAVVTPPVTPPVMTHAPAVAGTTVVGGQLTASPGSWTGTAPLAFTYQWQLCISACTNIAGATKGTLTLVASEIGGHLRVLVTAANAAGHAAAPSAEVGPVVPSSQEMQGVLSAELAPPAAMEHISALLHGGGYSATVSELIAGRLTISWYATAAPAHHSGRKTLVASGAAAFPAAGPQKIAVKLTAAGKKLLKQSKRLRVTVQAQFSPAGLAGVASTKSITLKH